MLSHFRRFLMIKVNKTVPSENEIRSKKFKPWGEKFTWFLSYFEKTFTRTPKIIRKTCVPYKTLSRGILF